MHLLKKKFLNIIKIALPLKNLDNDILGKFGYVILNGCFMNILKISDLTINQLKSFLKINGQIIIYNLPSSDGLIYKFSSILNKIGISTFYELRLWQKDLSSPHLAYFNNQNLTLLCF